MSPRIAGSGNIVGPSGCLSRWRIRAHGRSKVPLSEHEQHLLEQMEQALYAEDPKFASQMQGSAAREREPAGKTGKSRVAGKGPKSNKQTLMRRLEDRWDRRRHDPQ